MKANYSPGPWKANNITANHWTVEADSPHVKGKWQTVCDINGPWDAKNYKANALLIAAAPELLAACDLVQEAWVNSDIQMSEAVDACLLAIKKATKS